jgi:hypothetical protein
MFGPNSGEPSGCMFHILNKRSNIISVTASSCLPNETGEGLIHAGKSAEAMSLKSIPDGPWETTTSAVHSRDTIAKCPSVCLSEPRYCVWNLSLLGERLQLSANSEAQLWVLYDEDDVGEGNSS